MRKDCTSRRTSRCISSSLSIRLIIARLRYSNLSSAKLRRRRRDLTPPSSQDTHPRLLRRRLMPPRASSSSLSLSIRRCFRFHGTAHNTTLHTQTHTHARTTLREGRVSRYRSPHPLPLTTLARHSRRSRARPLITTSTSLNRDGGTTGGNLGRAIAARRGP